MSEDPVEYKSTTVGKIVQLTNDDLYKGWECPKCHKVYAPHISFCNCQIKLKEEGRPILLNE